MYMKRSLHISVLLTILALTSCPVFSADVIFHHLTSENGLGQVTINDIYQDELGYMWFATREGAIRYNGLSSTCILPLSYDTISKLGSNINHITGDGLGHVFILSNSVGCYNLTTQQMSILSESANVMAVKDSLLYIGYDSKIAIYNTQSLQCDTILSIPLSESDPINYIYVTDQCLIAGSQRGNVLRLNFEVGKWENLLKLNSCISVIMQDKQGFYWVGTWHNGLVRLNGSAVEHITVSSDFVRDILQASDGSIWIGTSRGLDHLTSDGFLHYGSGNNKYTQLSHESIWRIYESEDGTIWVGTYYGGVNYFNPKGNPFSYLPLPTIKQHAPIINSLVPVDVTSSYVCTEGDGLLLWNSDTNTFVSYPTPNIKASYWDQKNHLIYLGLHLKGLCSFNTQTCRFTYYQMPYEELLQNRVVRSIVPYESDLLCGTYNGVYCFSPKTQQLQVLSDTLNSIMPVITCMCIDERGQLWIGGAKGLCCYHLVSGKVRMVHTSECAFVEHIVYLKDKIYVATAGKGCYCFACDSYNMTRLNSLGAPFVHGMIATPKDNLLIVTTDAMLYYQPQTEQVLTYTSANGLPLSSLYNGCCVKLDDGSILVAGMDGIVKFREENLRGSTVMPNIILDNILVNGQFTNPSNTEIKLPYHSSLQLNVATDSYYDRPELRYKISNITPEWLTISESVPSIRLIDLPIGRHSIVIQALSARDHQVLNETKIVIYQRRPFYRSMLAYLLYLLLLVSIVTYLVRRLKYYYHRKAELEFHRKMQTSQDAIGRIVVTINENIANSQLNVELLASKVNLSRTGLFTIIKDTTNQTPTELITSIRLHRAAELLVDTKNNLTISQIAYDTGFNSPKYFASVFRKYYEMTPTEYRVKHSKL